MGTKIEIGILSGLPSVVISGDAMSPREFTAVVRALRLAHRGYLATKRREKGDKNVTRTK